jgi:hypothetical protein
MLSQQHKITLNGREIFYTKNTSGDYLVTFGSQDWMIKQRRWQDLVALIEQGTAMQEALQKCSAPTQKAG